MRRLLPLVFMMAWLPISARADVDATSFFVLKTADLKALLATDADLPKLNTEKLEELSLASGHFEGNCSLSLRTPDFDLRFKAHKGNEAEPLQFTVSLHSRTLQKEVFSCDGTAKLSPKFDVPVLPDKWREKEYVVVFARANLKK